eukprot:15433101-Alexandrium_andersonii.AAC.1
MLAAKNTGASESAEATRTAEGRRGRVSRRRGRVRHVLQCRRGRLRSPQLRRSADPEPGTCGPTTHLVRVPEPM